MEIGWNEWASLHWYCLNSETRGRSVVNGSAAAVDRSSGPCGGPGGQRNGNIADDLRYGRPLRHAFATCHVTRQNASLRDIALQVGQSIRAILIELALNVIFQSSPHALS
jgi:hypothetical protein